jgi:hypothetical protein
MTTSNEQDELIFDFLEGNLTPEEEEAFSLLKDESELVDREVRLWRNTFLEEALPSVEALEQKLFIQHGTQTTGWFSRVYAWLPILFLYMTFAGDYIHDEEVNALVGLHPSKTISHKQPSPSEAILICEEPVKSKLPNTSQRIATHELQSSEPLTATVALSELKKSTLVTPAIPVRRLEPVDVRIKMHRSLLAKKTWSKREMRLIRKRLWQNDQVRQLNEFRRGRMPYVVPLNNNNF